MKPFNVFEVTKAAVDRAMEYVIQNADKQEEQQKTKLWSVLHLRRWVYFVWANLDFIRLNYSYEIKVIAIYEVVMYCIIINEEVVVAACYALAISGLRHFLSDSVIASLHERSAGIHKDVCSFLEKKQENFHSLIEEENSMLDLSKRKQLYIEQYYSNYRTLFHKEEWTVSGFILGTVISHLDNLKLAKSSGAPVFQGDISSSFAATVMEQYAKYKRKTKRKAAKAMRKKIAYELRKLS